ncbi:MAG: LysM peptidoglycan-binding domain-containing protein [Tannerellaceae bacterium]|nr:LysM peptidoglycan-binding domain-containing protein [Tannerellaceae bacterium]
MSLKDKYSKLISYATSGGVQNLSVQEQNNILYIKGMAKESVKDQLWNLYQQADPDMRSADLVLDIDVVKGGEDMYEIRKGDNLSKIADKYPGMTWQKIYEANKDTLDNPDKIYPGQKIRIPL